MSKKMIVDAKAKRHYKNLINHYSALLNQKLNAGRITEGKFWDLQEKLDEWYSNFTPLLEVNDFSKF